MTSRPSDDVLWREVRARMPHVTDEQIAETGRRLLAARGKPHPYPLAEILAVEREHREITTQVPTPPSVDHVVTSQTDGVVSVRLIPPRSR